MLFGELLEELKKLTPEQLNCTLTVEDSAEDECYPAQFRIAGDQHSSLDEDHPIIYF